MYVLSLFYRMLTKKMTQGLRGDHHPKRPSIKMMDSRLKDKTASADLASPLASDINLRGGFLMNMVKGLTALFFKER